MDIRIVGRLTTGGALPSAAIAAGLELHDPDNHQQTHPIKLRSSSRTVNGGLGKLVESLFGSDANSLWVFRNRVIRVEDAAGVGRNEIVLRIKHKVFSEEEAYRRLDQDVERFQRLEKQSPTPREPIPDDVRMFVWRRDEGRCVRCGSQLRLEFDHIIPLEAGGSNTERNIQLLCESCNRRKGATI